MKHPILTTLAVVCLVVVSISGCTSPSKPKTSYYSREGLIIIINTTYVGNYTAYIPTLFINESFELSPIFKALTVNASHTEGTVSYLGLNSTDNGTLERIDASGNITLMGELYIKDDRCCNKSEAFTYNRWRPVADNAQLNSTIWAKARTDPENNTSDQFLHLDMRYYGNSNFCGLILGDIHLDGSWSVVVANNLMTVCK
jgi:hypothetical protein